MIVEYRYPQLRRGLVGSWCPSLGATGYTLLDRSGYNNHGTLTNMDPGTDWVGSSGRLALDFDGSNDFITPAIAQRVFPFSLSVWFNTRSSGNQGVFQLDAAGTTVYYGIGVSANAPYLYINDGTSNLNVNGSSVSGWTHIVAVGASATSHLLYINGRLNASSSTSRNPTLTTCTIGSFKGTSSFCNGLLDGMNIYNRQLTDSEIATLATRRGIEHETYRIPIVRGASGGGGGASFKPQWALGSNVLVGV